VIMRGLIDKTCKIVSAQIRGNERRMPDIVYLMIQASALRDSFPAIADKAFKLLTLIDNSLCEQHLQLKVLLEMLQELKQTLK